MAKYIFPKEKKFPVGDKEHERRAYAYALAGRISEDQIMPVFRYLAKHAKDEDTKLRALGALLQWRNYQTGDVAKAYGVVRRKGARRNSSKTDYMNYKARLWDGVRAAQELDRFTFIVLFVARMTRRKVDRDVTEGYMVHRTRGGWVYGWGTRPDDWLNRPTKDAYRLYDMIRRTPLNFYVRQAEEFRIDVHERQPFGTADARKRRAVEQGTEGW